MLADIVLPLIRTRADLHGRGLSNAHGRQMAEGVDYLEASVGKAEPAEVYAVTQKALASAVKVIARSDDSSGIIGTACRRLLHLHPRVAAAASVSPGRLVDWMVKFQFDGDVDYFEVDPVAYAPALGIAGVATYRSRLASIEAGLGPRPSVFDRWTSPHAHEWFVIEWNARRLAVLDRDVDAVIATHARDQRVAAWLEDAAAALEEIGETALAVEWAKRAAEFDHGHQALKAASYWCRLLAQHRPAELVSARVGVFRRWPSSSTAADLYSDAGASWPNYQEEVASTLATSPPDAVLFALLTLEESARAWDLAFALGLDRDDVWERLVEARERVDPLAVLPVLARLVDRELAEAGAQHYQRAARRLVRMRRLAAGSAAAARVDERVTELRHQHRRRPRLQREFDRAGLP